MIRVAVLGAGIGAQHLEAYRALPEHFEVAWVIDKDDARAASVAGGAPVAADMEIALADPSVDLIDICLPPHLHVPVTVDALNASKHAVCEKPIATALADIERLRAAQTETGKSLFPVFQYRFGPAFRKLKALRAEGLLGAPLVAALETHWARGADYYDIPWRGTWAGEQGGAVLGHAIHAHDLLCCHFGSPARVQASLTTRANPIETEDCAAIAFTLENGAVATSSITLGAAADETRLRFVFHDLTATSAQNPYAPGVGTWRFEARDPSHQSRVDDVIAKAHSGKNGFEGAFLEIAKALNGQDNSAVTFEDGAKSIELVTAIYASARSGLPETLPLPKDHSFITGWTP